MSATPSSSSPAEVRRPGQGHPESVAGRAGRVGGTRDLSSAQLLAAAEREAYPTVAQVLREAYPPQSRWGVTTDPRRLAALDNANGRTEMDDTEQVPAPTYDDGYRSGFDAAHGEVREEQLASVFDRDGNHVATLESLGRVIRAGLGRVAACDAQRTADRAVEKLLTALGALGSEYATVSREHREAAARLSAERRS